jgi:hypothetical protein
MYKIDIPKDFMGKEAIIHVEFDINNNFEIIGKSHLQLTEQGWNIKVPGKITGKFDNTTKSIHFEITGIKGKYSGLDYVLTITANGNVVQNQIVCDLNFNISSDHIKYKVSIPNV